MLHNKPMKPTTMCFKATINSLTDLIRFWIFTLFFFFFFFGSELLLIPYRYTFSLFNEKKKTPNRDFDVV